MLKRKTVTTITFLSIWKESEMHFSTCTGGESKWNIQSVRRRVLWIKQFHPQINFCGRDRSFASLLNKTAIEGHPQHTQYHIVFMFEGFLDSVPYCRHVWGVLYWESSSIHSVPYCRHDWKVVWGVPRVRIVMLGDGIPAFALLCACLL